MTFENTAQKYRERYAQGVILRDQTLKQYNTFLQNLGENTPLEKMAAEYIRQKGSCRILDIGCGNGQALHEVKQHVSSLVHTVGVDLLPLEDSRMLDEFIQGDVHTVPLSRECDIIVSFRALHEIGNFSTLLPRIAHALAPGGRAYLWIRFRDAHGTHAFEGEMSRVEEAYLEKLSTLSSLEGCRVLVEKVPVAETTSPALRTHAQPLSAGYVVLFMRPR